MSDVPFSPEDITPDEPGIFPQESVQVPNHEASKESPFALFKSKKSLDDDKPAKKPVPPMPRRGLKKPLTDIYTTLGTLWFPFDPVCGEAVINSAEQCAESLETLARENESVRRVLLALCETSAWGMVITAHLPILMAITAHHMPTFKGVPQAESQDEEAEKEAA